MEYKESITKETEQEVKDFLESHPSQCLLYWDWRESNNLILKIYKELEESTKSFGEEIDRVLKNTMYLLRAICPFLQFNK